MAFTSAIVMKNSDRTQILVLGERPIDREPFTQRRLTFTPITIESAGR